MAGKDTTKCKVCGKRRGHMRRGLCPKHYMAARRAVQSGEISWPEIERIGMAASPKRGGRRSDFREKLAAAKSGGDA